MRRFPDIYVALILVPLMAMGCASRPEKAQESFDFGCRAADLGLWNIAVYGFEEARAAAPDDPEIVYNLGVAHAKAGHPFEAASWLRFYLAMAPDAPNAAEVQREIARLDACVRIKEEEPAKPAP